MQTWIRQTQCRQRLPRILLPPIGWPAFRSVYICGCPSELWNRNPKQSRNKPVTVPGQPRNNSRNIRKTVIDKSPDIQDISGSFSHYFSEKPTDIGTRLSSFRRPINDVDHVA